ncbi:MAG: CHC2 zinc finger domain-containing protein [Chloroflexi bacterium]|nr:CHC2 zinc finger domain-containing protein [Chloroflexota bacterium]
MNAIAINQTTEIIPLLGYALKKAGGYHVGACPFCGGKDRFTVKRTSQGDRWHCRQCGDGKYHTVIDYIMRRDNVPFKTALQTLGGDVAHIIPRMVTPRPQPKPIQIPAQDWQGETWREVDAASAALLYHPQGEAARAFLTSRGISFAMWEAGQLGFMFEYDPIAKRKRPAIIIPWYDLDANGEIITAVKYRFIDSDPNPKALRYSSKGGSKFDIPFGLWDALPGFHHSLLFVEGELNCISVSQCRPAGVSVLSFGGEGSGDNRALQSLAERYKNVYVWADDVWDNPKQANHAKELRALVRGRGYALRSVKQGEVKRDANQLLQVGALSDYLSAVLGVECQASDLLPEVKNEM